MEQSLAVVGGGSSACRWPGGPRRPACGAGASVPGGQERSDSGIWRRGRLLGRRRHVRPAQRGLARRGTAAADRPESLRLWHDGFTDGLPADVVTARESLVVAVDRADVDELRTVADWLAAQGIRSP